MDLSWCIICDRHCVDNSVSRNMPTMEFITKSYVYSCIAQSHVVSRIISTTTAKVLKNSINLQPLIHLCLLHSYTHFTTNTNVVKHQLTILRLSMQTTLA